MKNSKAILFILLPFILASCGGKKANSFASTSKEDSFSGEINVSSEATLSSNPGEISSSVVSSSTPSVEIKDVLLYNRKTLTAGRLFQLEEFGDEFFTAVPHEDTSFSFYIYFGETKVLEEAPFVLYASDINKDGYRELVYSDEEVIEGVSYPLIHVYDIKNAKELARFDKTTFGTYYGHKLNLQNNHLILERIGGKFHQDVYDYAYFAYSNTKGVSLTFQNKFAIDSLSLVSITLNNAAMTLIESKKGDKGDYYELSANTRYLINIKMLKKDGTFNQEFPNEYGIGHLEEVGDITFNRFDPVSASNGEYQYSFDLSGARQKDVATFYFSEISFSISIQTL